MSSKNRPPRQTRKQRRPAHVPALADALHQIVAPVLSQFPPDADRLAVETLYGIARGVWNATRGGTRDDQLAALSALLPRDPAVDPDRAANVLAIFTARRHELFPDDAREIATLRFHWDGDTPRLEVTTSDPPRP